MSSISVETGGRLRITGSDLLNMLIRN